MVVIIFDISFDLVRSTAITLYHNFEERPLKDGQQSDRINFAFPFEVANLRNNRMSTYFHRKVLHNYRKKIKRFPIDFVSHRD